jgi:large conductance mechanosensitive channel
MRKFFKDFKVFITRGNVIQLATAVVIGGAFGKITTSFVSNILMPVVSLVAGKQSFEDIKTVLRPADEAQGITENAIYWGLFIQSVVDFLIIAFVIFVIVRFFTRLDALKVKTLNKLREDELKAEAEKAKKALEEAKKEPPKPTTESLLEEIKTLLEKNLNQGKST